jgi:5,5'-dehydrodivanillate O-demethylase
LEHLGVSDIGVIMYRELLAKQMTLANEGVDPMNVFRDPAKNQILEYPTEREEKRYGGRVKEEGTVSYQRKDYNPYWKDIEAVFREAAERRARGEVLLPNVYAPEGPILDHREANILP